MRAKGLGGDAPTTSALSFSGPGEDGEATQIGARPSGKASRTAQDTKEPARNAPCHCGSGKKYKQCHGRPGAV
ncbi:MAG: SEC-C metal-binding domain-containing protein [Nakamurella sp.]